MKLKFVTTLLLCGLWHLGWAQPANDYFTDRVTLSGTNFSVTGSNVGATNEPGEPNHAGFPASKSVWWTWTAPASNTVTVSTLGSSFSTVLAAYRGTVVSNLTNVASASLSILTNGTYASQFTFIAVSNTAYQVVVDGYTNSTGAITLNLFMGLPVITTQPPNRVVQAGASTSFSVVVAGSPPFRYQWVKDNIVIPNATNSSLAINNVQTADAAQYFVVVSNLFGAVTSSLVSLSVPIYEAYNFQTIASNLLNPDALVLDPDGDLFVAEYVGGVVRKLHFNGVGWTTNIIAGSGTNGLVDGANLTASFFHPNGIAIDSATNLYVTDAGNNAIRRISPEGTNWVVSTLITGLVGSALGGLAVDAATNIFFNEQGRHTIRKLSLSGTNWMLSDVAGLAGAPGNVDGANSDARFNTPDRVAIDASGVLYVGDYGNNKIRKITRVGINWVVNTLAGNGAPGGTDGTNAIARFNQPEGVAVDASGNVYVAEWINGTIRKITPTGAVTTLAGSSGSSGNTDGTGNVARFTNPNGIAVDSHGTVYVAQNGGSRIRMGKPVIRITPPTRATNLPPGGYQFNITLASYLNYRVQTSTNLANWSDLGGFFPTTMSYLFLDNSVSGSPIKFYRVVGP